MEGDPFRAQLAKHLLALRAARNEVFPAIIFADHAWAMLLEVFVALINNETIGELELHRRCDVSPGVGRRWLAYLQQEGFLGTEIGSPDVIMTERGTEAMRAILDRSAALSTSSREAAD